MQLAIFSEEVVELMSFAKTGVLASLLLVSFDARAGDLDAFAGKWVITSDRPHGANVEFKKSGDGYDAKIGSIGDVHVSASDGKKGSNIKVTSSSKTCYYFASKADDDLVWALRDGDCDGPLTFSHARLATTMPFEMNAILGEWSVTTPQDATGETIEFSRGLIGYEANTTWDGKVIATDAGGSGGANLKLSGPKSSCLYLVTLTSDGAMTLALQRQSGRCLPSSTLQRAVSLGK